jgi:hypothetical protein
MPEMSDQEIEELAKAMHEGLDGFDPKVRCLEFERLAAWVQESYRRQARAVVAHLLARGWRPPEVTA